MTVDGKEMAIAEREADIAELYARIARAKRDLLSMRKQKADKEDSIVQWEKAIEEKQEQLSQLQGDESR